MDSQASFSDDRTVRGGEVMIPAVELRVSERTLKELHFCP